MLGWDTETELIKEAKLAPELSCITFSHGDGAELIHHADPAAPRVARWILEQETTTANGSYDMAVLWAFCPDLGDLIWDALMNNRVHDVLIRQKLMDLGAGVYRRVYRRLTGAEKITLLGYGLSDVSARYTGVRMEKDDWRLKYGMLRRVPLAQWPQGAVNYAKGDAVMTSWAHDQQDLVAINEHPKHNLWDEPFQVRADWVLHLMSCWGFAVDLHRVEKVIADIDAEMPALIRRLKTVDLVRDKGAKKNVRNEKLAKQMMWSAVGDAGELTKTGYKRVKAGELNKSQALQAGYIKADEEWCEMSGYDALKDYFTFRQNQTLRTKLTSIRTAAMYSLPVQTSFETILETGRTSSSENKILRNSMALQNPPRKGGMRGCFKARDYCTLIACDYNQAELVSLAQVTYAAFGYGKMRELINSNMDLHVDFAKEILSIEHPSNPLDYHGAFAMHKAKDPIMKERRTLAKAFNFGKPGGLGAASFQSYARKAWGVKITFAQAKQLGYAWLKHFPEMVDYFKWMSGMAEAGGGKADIQQFFSKRWRGKCFYTAGCNTLFQGLTADAAKAALFEVSRHCYSVKSSALYGCRPVLFVHDEIITEARREQAAEAAVEKEKIMIEVYQRYTPDVKITAEAHLMDYWSKDAEAVMDERGKLVPWEPPQEEDERWEGMEAA